MRVFLAAALCCVAAAPAWAQFRDCLPIISKLQQQALESKAPTQPNGEARDASRL